MKSWYWLVALGLFLAASSSMAGDAAKPAAGTTTVQTMMRQKLSAAQALLEGVAREDLAKVMAEAKLLGEISKAASWHKPDSVEFQQYAKSFQNSAEFLEVMAREKNLEGVAMGYVRINLDCMQCHNFVRAGRKR